MRPSTFRRQNLDSSEKRTRDHCCWFHLPCRAQNLCLRALWRCERYSFISGFLEPTPVARTLFLKVCTEMRRPPGPRCCPSILRQGPSTKRRLTTVTAMYRSSCWVVTFGRPDLGRSETVPVDRWRSRSRIMVLRWTLNWLATSCGWMPASIWPGARALSSSESFLKALKGIAFAIITLTIQMRFWWNYEAYFLTKNHAKNAVEYVIG